jgi:hypothetical protein
VLDCQRLVGHETDSAELPVDEMALFWLWIEPDF